MLTTLLTKLANSCWHYPKRSSLRWYSHTPARRCRRSAAARRQLARAVNDDDPQVVRLKELKAQFPAGAPWRCSSRGAPSRSRRAVAQAASAALRRQPSILSATYRLDPFLAYQHDPYSSTTPPTTPSKSSSKGSLFAHSASRLGGFELIFSADEGDPSEAGQILDMTELIAGDVPDSMVSRQLSDLPLRSGWFATPAGHSTSWTCAPGSTPSPIPSGGWLHPAQGCARAGQGGLPRCADDLREWWRPPTRTKPTS